MLSTSQQIFLVSSNDEQSRILRRQLEPLTVEFYPLQFVSARPQSVVTSVDRQTAALVLTTKVWGKEESAMMEQLRRSGYRGPVVAVVGQRTPASSVPAIFEPLVFLNRPVSPREIQGVVRKFLSARRVQQQAFRRYPTEQEAEISFKAEDGQIDRRHSRLTNLSKGGAFVECLSPIALRVGEVFELKLELKDLKRTYTMPAKVIWAKENEGRHGVGFGVAFTGPAAIFTAGS